MLQKDNILIDNVKEKMKALNLNVVGLSKATSIPQGRIYKWFDGSGNPKIEDADILKEWIKKGKVEKPINSSKKLEDQTSSITAQTLADLAKSNLVLAEANKSLANGHEELVKIIKLSTANASQGTRQGEVSTIHDFLVLLSGVVAGRKYQTFDEALSALHTTSDGSGKNKPLKGNINL